MLNNSNLNTLVNEAIQNEVPNLVQYEQIAEYINSNSKNAYQFVDIIIKLLSSQRDPKQQYIILDLIEFTTCRCNMLLHKLYNDKKFLKLINAIFNCNNLTLLIKEKNLQLIQFWQKFFSGKEDILPNFNWYYQNIISRGIELPPYEPSKYLIDNKQKQQKIVQVINQDPQYKPNSKQAKLLKDLNVVKDNIKVANELIDNKDKEVAFQIIKTLKIMEVKLMQLPDILNKEGEDYLYKLSLALLQDIENTKGRYEDLRAKKKLQKFVMMSDTIKQEIKIQQQPQQQQQSSQIKQQYFQQAQQFEFGSQSNLYKPDINSSIKKDIPLKPQNNDIDLLGFDMDQQPQHNSQQNSQQSSLKYSQDLLQNNSHQEFFQSPQQNQSHTSFNIQNQMKTSQQNINDFNNQFNDFQINNTSNDNKQDMDVDLLGLDIIEQPQKKQQSQQQHPQDIISYNKPLQEKMKKEKIEYDPFADIDLLQLNQVINKNFNSINLKIYLKVFQILKFFQKILQKYKLMVKVKTLQGYECDPQIVNEVTLPTMDTYLRGVDTEQFHKYPHNFIHVMHPHLKIEKENSNKKTYDELLNIGKQNMQNMIKQKIFQQSKNPCVYIYKQQCNNYQQTGILLSLHYSEYINGNVKKHEQVIDSKVNTICKIINSLGVYNSAPATFCDFPIELNKWLVEQKKQKPIYDFIVNDTRHILIKIKQDQSQICIDMVQKIKEMYIADGHHRFKTYSKLCEQINKKQNKQGYLDDYEYFPVFVFPKSDLQVHKFNRYIYKDNNLTLAQILQKIEKKFQIEEIIIDQNKITNDRYKDYIKKNLKPKIKGDIIMYHQESKKWFKLTRLQYYECALKNLDVNYLSENILKEVLDLDLQCRAQIDYIPCYKSQPQKIIQDFRENNAKICFILTDVSLQEIENVSNENKIMPPKTTLFYPKPMIGMVLKNFKILE